MRHVTDTLSDVTPKKEAEIGEIEEIVPPFDLVNGTVFWLVLGAVPYGR